MRHKLWKPVSHDQHYCHAIRQAAHHTGDSLAAPVWGLCICPHKALYMSIQAASLTRIVPYVDIYRAPTLCPDTGPPYRDCLVR